MAYVDKIQIGTSPARYIRSVAEVLALPTIVDDNSPQLVRYNNELYLKVQNNSTYSYKQVGGGSGTIIIDITGLDEIPTQYRDAELLKTAILFDIDHLLRLTWIDDMYYYGNTDDFQYRYLSVDTNDFIIMRYALQDIAKASKIINLNDYVPSTATNGTLTSDVLATLQENDQNYIVFNNEIFKLADKQHNEGYIVYSHNGHDTTGCFFQKCITITLSTRGWVLETQENQAKLTAGSNISIVNNVISATGGGGSTPSKTIITGDVVNDVSSSLGDVVVIQLTQPITDFENASISTSFNGIPFVLNHLKSNVFKAKVFIEQYATNVYVYGFYHEVDGDYVLYTTFSSIDGIAIPKNAEKVDLTLIEYTFYKDAIINELLFVMDNVDGSGEGQTLKLHGYNSMKQNITEWYDTFTIYYALVGFVFVSFILTKINDTYNGTIVHQNCNFTNVEQTN